MTLSIELFESSDESFDAKQIVYAKCVDAIHSYIMQLGVDELSLDCITGER